MIRLLCCAVALLAAAVWIQGCTISGINATNREQNEAIKLLLPRPNYNCPRSGP